MKTFEDYLAEKHMEQFTGIKDQLPDAFYDWLEGLCSDEWLNYGEQYAIQCRLETLNETKEFISRI